MSRWDKAAKQSPRLLRLGSWLEATLFGGIFATCRLLPTDAASGFGDWLGRRIGPRLRKHKDVIGNLRTAFPEWAPERIERTARAIWGQGGRTIAEFTHLEEICRQGNNPRFEIVERGDLSAIKRGERPGVFVTAHLGNWNLAPAAASHLGIPVTIVYSPQTNDLIELMIERYRPFMGAVTVSSEAAGRQLIEELRRGQSLGIVVDQRFKGGEPVTFFGRPTPTAVAPARIAVRMGVDFIPVRVERLKGARFRVTAYPSIRPDPAIKDSRLAAHRMVEDLYRLFEQWITERPEQWFCAKRRWTGAASDAGETAPGHEGERADRRTVSARVT